MDTMPTLWNSTKVAWLGWPASLMFVGPSQTMNMRLSVLEMAKEMMKKKMAWVALAMAMLLLLLLLTASPSSLFVASAAQQLPGLLQFSHNGRFKILQVADMHYANGAETACEDVLPNQFASCSDLNTTTFLNRMIEAEKPDLIVFTET
ncbi:hypothetical protein O6H91_Y566400 [Diphasiastrum complanatum]|nr:hypothetical protein O6H91_Y566400 [Diphasiastrum complanatum]